MPQITRTDHFFHFVLPCPGGCLVGTRSLLGRCPPLDAALIHTPRFVATDKCVENVEANLGPRGLAGNARVRRLEWASAQDLAMFEPPYDVVLAGDCLYEEACVAPLLQTMWALAGPKTEVSFFFSSLFLQYSHQICCDSTPNPQAVTQHLTLKRRVRSGVGSCWSWVQLG